MSGLFPLFFGLLINTEVLHLRWYFKSHNQSLGCIYICVLFVQISTLLGWTLRSFQFTIYWFGHRKYLVHANNPPLGGNETGKPVAWVHWICFHCEVLPCLGNMNVPREGVKAPWRASCAKKAPGGIFLTFSSTFHPVFSCVSILSLPHTFVAVLPLLNSLSLLYKMFDFIKFLWIGTVDGYVLMAYYKPVFFPSYNTGWIQFLLCSDGARWGKELSFCPLHVHGNQLIYVILMWSCQIDVLMCTHMNWKALQCLTVYV